MNLLRCVFDDDLIGTISSEELGPLEARNTPKKENRRLGLSLFVHDQY